MRTVPGQWDGPTVSSHVGSPSPKAPVSAAAAAPRWPSASARQARASTTHRPYRCVWVPESASAARRWSLALTRYPRRSIPAAPDGISSLMEEVSTEGKLAE